MRETSRKFRDAYVNGRANRALVKSGAGTPKANGRGGVVVHFSDDTLSLYQIRQWYGPLEELARHMPVAVLCRVPLTAQTLLSESPVPVFYRREMGATEACLTELDPRVIFYVNHHPMNLSVMSAARALHVFISHGESEKSYMTWGQIRAYDFHFIAGQAARERLARNLINYDVDARTRVIGRPQLDFLPPDISASLTPTTILYAPTYEGDRGSMRYGSIDTHGESLVRSLVEGGYRVIYRAHPKTGSNDPAYAAAHRRICDYLASVNAGLDPGTTLHAVDSRGQIDSQIAEAAAGITDNSAMALDFLATGKPTIVTRGVSAAPHTETGYVASCYRIERSEAHKAAQKVAKILAEDELAGERRQWISHYFGDTTRGHATRLFIEATQEIAEHGSHELAWRETGAGQPPESR